MRWIKEHFKKEWKQYYRTIELNELLYFHYKGFGSIECMELFPDLKCLYFEGNGITQIKGLATNVHLRSLMLQENLIKKMEGLTTLTNLRTLNLSENVINKVEGLDQCVMLTSLYLKKNRIGAQGNSQLEGLLDCPSLECVELAHNLIEDPSCVVEVFQKMPNLKVLYLNGNDMVKKVRSYRKTVIADLPKLRYLDDRPVFEDDRRASEAFAKGGLEAERAERAQIKAEKQAAHEK